MNFNPFIIKSIIIDASNIKIGGGLTHLKEFIDHASPRDYGIKNIIVWGDKHLLDSLANKDWLIKKYHYLLNRGYFSRIIWRYFVLKNKIRHQDILFIPGTGHMNTKSISVTMCRNLLPIDKKEMDRFCPSFNWCRYRFLRSSHFRSYVKSNGVIFLHHYSYHALPDKVKSGISDFSIIPHGISNIFKENYKTTYNFNGVINLLYVSRINLYKHQWNVARAVYDLNKQGLKVTISLVGGMDGPGRDKLDKVINENAYQFPGAVKLYDLVSYEGLPDLYKNSDIFIFASSCETFGNILLEAMSIGLPIACSNASSMHELLEDAGLYFNPEDVNSIKSVLIEYIYNESLRKTMGKKAKKIANKYSWNETTNRTFDYLIKLYKNNV